MYPPHPHPLAAGLYFGSFFSHIKSGKFLIPLPSGAFDFLTRISVMSSVLPHLGHGFKLPLLSTTSPNTSSTVSISALGVADWYCTNKSKYASKSWSVHLLTSFSLLAFVQSSHD